MMKNDAQVSLLKLWTPKGSEMLVWGMRDGSMAASLSMEPLSTAHTLQTLVERIALLEPSCQAAAGNESRVGTRSGITPIRCKP